MFWCVTAVLWCLWWAHCFFDEVALAYTIYLYTETLGKSLSNGRVTKQKLPSSQCLSVRLIRLGKTRRRPPSVRSSVSASKFFSSISKNQTGGDDRRAMIKEFRFSTSSVRKWTVISRIAGVLLTIIIIVVLLCLIGGLWVCGASPSDRY